MFGLNCKLRAIIAFIAFLGALSAPFMTAAAQEQSAIARVQSTGVLRIATEGGNPPYSSLGTDGQPRGFDVDIANRLAASMKLKPEFVIVDAPGRITALQTGRADVTVANFTNTIERSMAIAFTRPYLTVTLIFAVEKGSPIQSVEDLNDAKYKIGVIRGGTPETVVAEILPKASILRFDTIADAYLALKSGQVDAQLQDSYQNASILQREPDVIRNLPGTYGYEEIAIGLPAGDPDWLRVVDTWVRQFNGSGEGHRLFKEHFGFELNSTAN